MSTGGEDSAQKLSSEDVQTQALAHAAPYRFDQIESGVRIAISDALPSSAGVQFEKWLTVAVRELRPSLKPFVDLVVVMIAGPTGTEIATAAGDAAIIVWCRRRLWNAKRHPEITVRTLEHEAAHILWVRTGTPNDETWESIVRDDAADRALPLDECLILPDIAKVYDRSQWLQEDWAYSVELSGDPRFADRFAARSRRIAEICPTSGR